MNEPILPYVLADSIVRNNFYRTTQGNAIPVIVIAKPRLVVRLKIIHFHGADTCHHPDFIKTFSMYLGHLHRSRITVSINGCNGHIFTMSQMIEFCLQFLDQWNVQTECKLSPVQAKEQMLQHFPYLKRLKEKDERILMEKAFVPLFSSVRGIPQL